MAAAQDATVVRVTCDTLTPEDAAQVEARTRATLLLSDDTRLSVRIDCVADQATVRVAAGERTETTVLTLSGENARDALVAAVERTLEALERPGEPGGATVPPPTAATKVAPGAAAIAPPAKPETDTKTESTSMPERAPETRSWQVGAGALGELWDSALGLGARLATERRIAPMSLGMTLGWLRALGGDGEAFQADELHAFVYGALEEQTTGLTGSLGAGISVLTVSPDSEVVAQSSTMLSLVMLELGLSRPVRFGRAALLPAVHLRVFPARREVNVDAAHRLVLPPLCPSLFLGFGYEL
ncbi:MAG TPA: hypothetical protein VFV94_11745 [Polyangiaceae bacterium]|nr:hypothetical protein [Polyangiaceae bacterium]